MQQYPLNSFHRIHSGIIQEDCRSKEIFLPTPEHFLPTFARKGSTLVTVVVDVSEITNRIGYITRFWVAVSIVKKNEGRNGLFFLLIVEILLCGI